MTIRANLATSMDALSELSPGMTLLAGLGLLLVVAHEAVRDAAIAAEARHNRAELLRAYLHRRRWKASDRANLLTLPLSPVAQRRLAGLAGRGRPVVEQHRELAEVVLEKLQPFAVVADKTSSPTDRLKALKQLPWWPHFVESLYRGEYQLAKTRGECSPAFAAEGVVGCDLGVSQPMVHRLCGHVRRLRRACEDDANFEPRTLAELRAWLRDGGSFTVWG